MYSARINGDSTTFGTSGMLYRSNKLMYDRTTNSIWSSLNGEPVIGPLAFSGIKPSFFPAVMSVWSEWLSEHPDTTVISTETGIFPAESYEPENNPASSYFSFRENSATMFPVWNRDSRLEAKDEVLGLLVGDVYTAYPIEILQRERLVNDEVGEVGIVVLASSESSSARVYERSERVFSLVAGNSTSENTPTELVDDQGNTWQVTEDALVNTAMPSLVLPRLPAFVSFWVGWFSFHPDTLLYGVPAGE